MVFLKESVETYINIASYVPWHTYESMDWKKHMQQDVLFMFSEIEVYDSVCIQ